MHNTQNPPDLLDELATILSGHQLLRLLAIFGGIYLYIPKTATADHPIAKSIGLDGAERLAKVFGADQIKIPRGEEFRHLMRLRTVAALLHKGVSPREVAALVGCTPRQIFHYRREAESLGILPQVFGSETSYMAQPPQCPDDAASPVGP